VGTLQPVAPPQPICGLLGRAKLGIQRSCVKLERQQLAWDGMPGSWRNWDGFSLGLSHTIFLG